MILAMVILFGLLAGIPTALLVLASEKRREQDYDSDDEGYREEAAAYLARYQRG